MHHKESCYKVGKCIYHQVCITGKVFINLQNVYIIPCASQGKLVVGCGVYHHGNKVAEYISYDVCITSKVVIKLRNVYMITCTSQRK